MLFIPTVLGQYDDHKDFLICCHSPVAHLYRLLLDVIRCKLFLSSAFIYPGRREWHASKLHAFLNVPEHDLVMSFFRN